jgi:hypothetical protein
MKFELEALLPRETNCHSMYRTGDWLRLTTVTEALWVCDVSLCTNMFTIRKTYAHKQLHAVISRLKDNEALKKNKCSLFIFYSSNDTSNGCLTFPLAFNIPFRLIVGLVIVQMAGFTLPNSYMRLCAFIYRGVLVSAPLQAFVCFFLFA